MCTHDFCLIIESANHNRTHTLTCFLLFCFIHSSDDYLTLIGKLPFEYQKIAKNLTFFLKIAKNFNFFEKNCHWQFFWKNENFWQFFWKNVKFLAIFWQSNGNVLSTDVLIWENNLFYVSNSHDFEYIYWHLMLYCAIISKKCNRVFMLCLDLCWSHIMQ